MADPCGGCASPVLLEERCTACGLCAQACPCGAAQPDQAGKPVFLCERCCTGDANCVACVVGFQPCQAVCEAGAIQVAFTIRRWPEEE